MLLRKITTILLASVFAMNLISSESTSDIDPYSQNVFGGIGLIQTPSARFSDDGEFLFGISSEDPYNRLYSKVQIFPWMEAVLRYTEGTYKPYNPGSLQTWKDKGIDFKFRLLEETSSMPQVAFGLTDFGGTGAYSSEYFVASKAYNNFDFSIGLGWGRLGGVDHIDNLFSFLHEGEGRGGTTQYGGLVKLERFFSGENTSIFGGFEYQLPIENMTFKVEYDTSDYSDVINREKVIYETGDIFQIDSRINYALNYGYQVSERDQIDLSLGFIRGNTIYANLSVHSNLNFQGRPKIIMGAEKLRNTNLRANSYQELDENRQRFLMNRIIKELANSGFVTHGVFFKKNELAAEISQSRFTETSKFIDLASRILANNALPNIEKITVINFDQGIETMRTSVNRDDLRKAVLRGPLPEDLVSYNEYNGQSVDAVYVENEFLYPNLYWEIKPNMAGTIQHQEKFYFWQLQAILHAEYAIRKGLYFSTDIGINIDNNFDEYTYHVPDGELYHVRQDRRLYLTEGESGIRRLAFDYTQNFSPNIKGKFSAGLLEWMYGGVGGEVIYMPESKRWAFGIDAHFVKQRDYDQKFSFKDYKTLTALATFYRDIPFYNTRLKISGGRFLAKDRGVHIDISRRFSTGARVGGIIALTDCDATCVGEGSFNKWIYFEMPMDLFYINSSTKQRTGFHWSPLTKDAGQRIHSGSLYSMMMSSNDQVDSLRQKQWSIKKIFSGFGTKPRTKT